MAAVVTSGILSGLGLEVARIGSSVVNEACGFSMDLADSRSSIFAITAIVAYSLVCVYIMRARIITKALIVLTSIPLLIVSNIIRGLVVMLIASALDKEAGHIAYTYLSGPILFFISFGGVTFFCIKKHLRDAPQKNETNNPVYSKQKSVSPAWYITLAVIFIGAVWIPKNLDVVHVDESGVNLIAPRLMGSWTGGPILFCHTPSDRLPYSDPDLKAGGPCPDCGEPLYEMSSIERRLLPSDTILKKSRYDNPDEHRVLFTIVLSGQKRSSIHRPEVCLVGPNSEIDRSFIHTVDLGNDRTLDVKILEMVHRIKKPDGTIGVWTSYYAYWFAGVNRETPYHIQRMIWMASDRLFRNKSYRWAYISASGARTPQNTSYLTEIDNFLQSAYPHLHK